MIATGFVRSPLIMGGDAGLWLLVYGVRIPEYT